MVEPDYRSNQLPWRRFRKAGVQLSPLTVITALKSAGFEGAVQVGLGEVGPVDVPLARALMADTLDEEDVRLVGMYVLPCPSGLRVSCVSWPVQARCCPTSVWGGWPQGRPAQLIVTFQHRLWNHNVQTVALRG